MTRAQPLLEATAGAASHFRDGLSNPRAVQEAILFSTLRRNCDSEYGRRFGFNNCRSVADFQRLVPIVRYDDLAGEICRVCDGEPGVLTTEPPLIVEETSGSSGAVKRIPYTASLRREFNRALGAWIHDVYTREPQLQAGTAYWSLSPLARRGRTAGGLTIGFENDRDYFDGPAHAALGAILTLPPGVVHIEDLEEQRRVTLGHLLADADLAFISVWNPSFLTILMDRLGAMAHSLIERIAVTDPHRARELERSDLEPVKIWPRLSVISCWTDAAAALALPALRRRFDGVAVQPKGLLATEGVVSIPFGGARRLAVTSHFLEFRDRRNGQILLCDALRNGCRYDVILTTGGGLYRYDIGDIIRIEGEDVVFDGRSDDVTDMAGEKLSEKFVRSVLGEVASETDFMFLAPQWDEPPGYVLFADCDAVRLPSLVRRVEESLGANPHYSYCRRIGQLRPLQGIRLLRGAADAYLRLRAGNGRVGDVKPRSLEKETGWRDRLTAAGVVA